MTTSMVTQGFHHVAMKVHNFDATLQFYVEGLGLIEAKRWGEGNERAVMLATGNDNYLEIFAGGAEKVKPEGAVLHFAFRVNNTDEALARAVKSRGKSHHGAHYPGSSLYPHPNNGTHRLLRWLRWRKY